MRLLRRLALRRSRCGARSVLAGCPQCSACSACAIPFDALRQRFPVSRPRGLAAWRQMAHATDPGCSGLAYLFSLRNCRPLPLPSNDSLASFGSSSLRSYRSPCGQRFEERNVSELSVTHLISGCGAFRAMLPAQLVTSIEVLL